MSAGPFTFSIAADKAVSTKKNNNSNNNYMPYVGVATRKENAAHMYTHTRAHTRTHIPTCTYMKALPFAAASHIFSRAVQLVLFRCYCCCFWCEKLVV